MQTRFTVATAALGAVLLSAMAAPAAAADQKGSASLSYSDLDLSTVAGRTELARRFDQAAREKCGATGDKLKGTAKYCYKATSEQYRHYVADILRSHDSQKADTGLALR